MFLVKISYHHQRRLAIHYRVCFIQWFRGCFPCSRPTPVCLSVWSSPVWGWAVSTDRNTLPSIFSTKCSCPSLQAQLLSGKCKERFFWTGQMKSIVKCSVVSNTACSIFSPRRSASVVLAHGRGRCAHPGPASARRDPAERPNAACLRQPELPRLPGARNPALAPVHNSLLFLHLVTRSIFQ